jgi:hypothetical protein
VRLSPILDGLEAAVGRLTCGILALEGVRVPGGDLEVGGAKTLLDGSAAGRTAWRYEDYPVDARHPTPTSRGISIMEPDVYKKMVLEFNAAGVSVGTHAIGDRAIDLAVDAYAEALNQNPSVGLRHSVIHAHEPTEHALEVWPICRSDMAQQFQRLSRSFYGDWAMYCQESLGRNNQLT